ncbi:MAG: DNA-processing protein DprA [bacterium]|nr:DNA-processing protein DprA [bacterium]
MGIHNCQDGVIKIENKKYPKILRGIGKEAPKQLYYKGDISLLQADCLAVVGSRRITTYGKQIVEKMVSQIASAGVVVVSGFMYGVDAMAHKAAVEAGGRTIAVMPCGIERVHPEYQIKLYNDILESGGLVISEYEGNMQPALFTYPARNRIVAGLSKAVLVVEAAEKSGSLITAGLAEKFKRKLLAVPGPVNSIVSKGTNDLIKNRKAEMVLDADGILKYFGNRSTPSVKDAPTLGVEQVGPLENLILQKLRAEPMEIDILARGLEKPISELSALLSIMEIKDLIKNINGKYHIN